MKKLLSLLSILSLTSSASISTIACKDTLGEDNDENLDELRNELNQELEFKINDHISLMINQNSIIDSSNEEEFKFLNENILKEVAYNQNIPASGSISDELVNDLKDDIYKIVKLENIQSLIKDIIDQEKYEKIASEFNGDILVDITLHTENGFGLIGGKDDGTVYVNWSEIHTETQDHDFIGNISVDFSTEINFLSNDLIKYNIRKNITTVITNNAKIGEATNLYLNKIINLLNREDILDVLAFDSKGVYDKKTDEDNISLNLARAFEGEGDIDLNSIIIDEIFKEIFIDENLGLEINKTETEDKNIIASNSLVWENEFFKNNQISINQWIVPSREYTKEWLETNYSGFGFSQAVNLVWGVDMGEYDASWDDETATIARNLIIDDYINRFNLSLNQSFSDEVSLFIDDHQGFESKVNAIIKYGYADLTNLVLHIDDSVSVQLPSITIPLVLTVEDSENRIDDKTSEAYAENIRRALATIQYYYSIDVNQYQEGAQSLFGGFNRDTIEIDDRNYNFYNDVLYDVSSINSGNNDPNSDIALFKNRFNFSDESHWTNVIKSLINEQIGQTNSFEHSLGTDQETYLRFAKISFADIDGFNLSQIAGPGSSRRLVYQLTLDYFALYIGGQMIGTSNADYSDEIQNFLFTRKN